MKKIIITALTAVMALSMFTSCAYKAEYKEADAVGAENAVITIDNAEISGGYWAEASGIDKDNKCFYLNCGQYASYEMKLATPVNLDNAEVTIKIKKDSALAAGEDGSYFKFAAKTTDTMVSEYATHKDEEEKTIEFFGLDDLEEDYKEIKFNTSDMWKGWSADDSIKAAYLPCISTIIINPQDSMRGKVYIESITIKNN